MKTFNDTDFLLLNDYGRKLYGKVAASLPVIDPHNHIDPAALATNKKFENIYQLWVQGDPYKHRAMRIYGIAEDFITGSRTDYEKFFAWAEVYPHTVGNPLYHWCAMELKEVFGIKKPLSAGTAKSIWETASKKLAKKGFGALDIVKSFGVEMLCTSDDLLDSLTPHLSLAKQDGGLLCLPSLRSDSIIALAEAGFDTWLRKLQTITSVVVTNLSSYKEAVAKRLDFLDKAGCLLSDHSLDSGFRFVPTDEATASNLFAKVLAKGPLNEEDAVRLQSHLLHFLGKEYAGRKWKMQLHIGAQRYTSSRLRSRLGPAGGYACIGMATDIKSLTLFLDGLDSETALPKTVVYNLNPVDNAKLASLAGSFAEDGVQGKIQFGPAWWYNDHHEGITQQLLALSTYGLLSTSIGMTTDSRSILSFLRHDYYRRILCNLVGSWVEEGKVPDDWKGLSTLVKNVAYNNIKNWIQK